MKTKYLAISFAAMLFTVFFLGVSSANAAPYSYEPAPSEILFEGFGTLIQLMETYRVLVLIIGSILFVVAVVLAVFPEAREFLGNWFTS